MLRVRPDPIAYAIGENYRFLPEGHTPLLLLDNVGRTETFKPAQWIDYLAHEFPGIWQWYAKEIEWRKGWKPWHSWCFCPSASAAHFLGDDFEAFRDWTWAIAGIVAWRATQGVYRFGEVLLEELLQTPVVGDIPVEHLQRLPEWCVYAVALRRIKVALSAVTFDALTGTRFGLVRNKRADWTFGGCRPFGSTSTNPN